ncbi:hypothetical protein PUN28_015806 [Cardiocondyla obscurior]|uniref:Uncharacterized protein n=1 Tax=Cardiocondyla obscurior TaxID=286306 RepID=A0AAW2ET16_9HYME
MRPLAPQRSTLGLHGDRIENPGHATRGIFLRSTASRSRWRIPVRSIEKHPRDTRGRTVVACENFAMRSAVGTRVACPFVLLATCSRRAVIFTQIRNSWRSSRNVE